MQNINPLWLTMYGNGLSFLATDHTQTLIFDAPEVKTE